MKYKLIKYHSNYLSEIFQSIDVKFSFVKKETENTFKQIHSVVKCRDFLGDCVWSKKTGNAVSIYNFNYKYKENPFDEKQLQLSMTFPDKKTLNVFTLNFHLLNDKEEKAKVKKSKYFKTNCPLSIIIVSSKCWQSSIWKISLFTYYLKLFCYKSIDHLQDPEKEYSEYLIPKTENKLISKVKTKKEHLYDNISMAHNYSGFVSVIKGDTNKIQHKEIFT